MNLVLWLGGVAALLTALTGTYAAVVANRARRKADATAEKSADRETTQQAINTIMLLNERLEARATRLEEANERLEGQANAAVTAMNEMKLMHERCTDRLADIELALKAEQKANRELAARVAELGG